LRPGDDLRAILVTFSVQIGNLRGKEMRIMAHQNAGSLDADQTAPRLSGKEVKALWHKKEPGVQVKRLHVVLNPVDCPARRQDVKDQFVRFRVSPIHFQVITQAARFFIICGLEALTFNSVDARRSRGGRVIEAVNYLAFAS
jgi:hypothetical protein